MPTFTAPSLGAGGADLTLTFQLEVTDAESKTDTATVTITVTAQATVSSVSVSSTAGGTRDDTYVRGQDIDVAVQFSENVTVVTTGGTPRLGVTIGSATRYASYDSTASTANTLTFTYTVASGDTDANGVSIAANAIDLNGGAINDASELAANLNHSAVDASASHKVDGSIAIGQPKANAGADQVVAQGSSTPVTLDGSGSSDPNTGQTLTYAWSQTAPTTGAGSGLTLSSATAVSPTFSAPAIAAGGSDITLEFRLTVTDSGQTPLTDTDDVTITVTRQATVSAVGGVTISSTSGTTRDDTYVRDETISVAVQFTENVTVDTTDGTPRLPITIGSATGNADYASGSGGTTLTFNYTVQSGDADTDGVSIAANALILNGGTISDDSGLAADLAHSAVDAGSSHQVDGSIATGTPVAITGADRTVAAGYSRNPGRQRQHRPQRRCADLRLDADGAHHRRRQRPDIEQRHGCPANLHRPRHRRRRQRHHLDLPAHRNRHRQQQRQRHGDHHRHRPGRRRSRQHHFQPPIRHYLRRRRKDPRVRGL